MVGLLVVESGNHESGPRPVSEEPILDACGDTSIPEMGVIEQVWDTNPIPTEEVRDRAVEAVSELELDEVPDGGEVAVGAGSRGIANIPDIVGGVVDGLRRRGYEPFVFPTMGSHGGATAEGQREMLESLGMTEDVLRCEIRATMDTVGVESLDAPRVVRIRDTMHLERIKASPALLAEARERDDLRVVSDAEPVAFESGQLEEDVLGA